MKTIIDAINAVTHDLHTAIDSDNTEAFVGLSHKRGELIKELCTHETTDTDILNAIKSIIADTDSLFARISNEQQKTQTDITRVNHTRKALNQYDMPVHNTQGYFIDNK